jgi:glutathionylspermidine synthase
MRHIAIEPRRNLAERARAVDFELSNGDASPYWDESAYYAFSLPQIEAHLESPTEAPAALCLALVERAARDERILQGLKIPRHAWNLIAESWRRGDRSLYGRFDLAYDGNAQARLLEYNADTPTALFEAAVFQWTWLEDAIAARVVPAGSDQFNSIHEKLIARFAEFARAGHTARVLRLAAMPEAAEDRGVVCYLADCATQAGLVTEQIAIGDIGDAGTGRFLDLEDRAIDLLFKLYPWEWMFADEFSRSASMFGTHFLEPRWKAILSSKGILPLLWEMAPGHPNLLEAYFEDDPARARLSGRYARKPRYSREGQNVELVEGASVLEQGGGRYGREGFIVQELARLPAFDGNYPVVGSWVIGEAAGGIGIREDATPITKNTSRFLPHAIEP